MRIVGALPVPPVEQLAGDVGRVELARSPHPRACAGSSGRSRRTALPTRRGRARTRAFPKRVFALVHDKFSHALPSAARSRQRGSKGYNDMKRFASGRARAGVAASAPAGRSDMLGRRSLHQRGSRARRQQGDRAARTAGPTVVNSRERQGRDGAQHRHRRKRRATGSAISCSKGADPEPRRLATATRR